MHKKDKFHKLKRYCTGCEEHKYYACFYSNGKQKNKHSKCKDCWLGEYKNGHQRELLARYHEGGSLIGICLCGSFYSMKVRTRTGAFRSI